jgi:hypothetical protein
MLTIESLLFGEVQLCCRNGAQGSKVVGKRFFVLGGHRGIKDQSDSLKLANDQVFVQEIDPGRMVNVKVALRIVRLPAGPELSLGCSTRSHGQTGATYQQVK